MGRFGIIGELIPFMAKKQYSLQELDKIANEIRQDIIRMLLEAGSGHSAGPLGMADVFTALYFAVMNHDPKNPDWEERDRLILSNGHICPVRYAAMARAGYFPLEELKTLRKFGSRLQGHPERKKLPGVETTSGPLGSGLSQAAGMAYVAKYIDKKNWRVFCAMSDGEQEAGQTWEAAMFAGKNKLNNLTGIIDRNNIQIDGYVEDIMPLEPLRAKYEAFNWNVIEIDGHNIEEIIDACSQAKATQEKPTCIIAHTIPGKGVSFMENKFEWHGKPPKPEEAKTALRELRAIGVKITGIRE
ncbi:MAG: Transketolase domain protein [Parcubacteria group bacterium GW2011_GWA2_50_10]|uniref:Transketolase domain protein n=2 Tax=Parcubacteria group TaxID=1794811 RepID=A0A837ISB4_9BACT|nr:MAG: Transketolase domain protein [Candidatus Yanofskybacteria bacterium GW2011_GWC1_48_11]KKW04479.1 MAG: Transketolase domain protein [Parcubacteria group bacterium GW2011_GWB1_49_12]KKW09265.1 MAG: Transketolase domain protein [Parcubacteria group bacterium GW2011_GWA1_49_26]KKW14097.1 MAG: Transketolase domain protein [Parcubacteria group bacterium GW2011_GWA2_50_10]